MTAKHKLHELPILNDDLYDAQHGVCFHCLRHMDPWPFTIRHQNGYTREHVRPISDGGTARNNIVLAHQWCNQKRGTEKLSHIDQMRAKIIIKAVIAKRGGW